MAWTESRSRDEWLAEVRRRGERLRRRRQVTVALVGALALVLPVGALATFLAGDADRDVRLTLAGPAPAGDVAPDSVVDGPGRPEPAEERATTTTAAAEVQEPVAPSNGSVPPPSPPRSVPAIDDPVVRLTTTTAPFGNRTGSPAQGAQSASAPTASTEPVPGPCVATDFKLTLSIARTTFGPGERVEASATFEKRSAGRCSWPSWGVEFRILNGAGKDVSDATRSYSTSSTHHPHPDGGRNGTEYAVGPGTVRTDTLGWEACAQPWPIVVKDDACVPFPAGTYTVVAEWAGTATGPSERATFQISG